MDYNQNNYQDQGHELGWEDTVTEDAKEYVLLPEGNYEFTVGKITRSRFNGSDKMPACNVAIVQLIFKSPQGDSVYIDYRLNLHSKFEWKISEFFSSIGLKKKGEPLRMNWNIVGLKGKCKIGTKLYKDETYNEIKRFYSAEEAINQMQNDSAPYAQQRANYTPGKW